MIPRTNAWKVSSARLAQMAELAVDTILTATLVVHIGARLAAYFLAVSAVVQGADGRQLTGTKRTKVTESAVFAKSTASFSAHVDTRMALWSLGVVAERTK